MCLLPCVEGGKGVVIECIVALKVAAAIALDESSSVCFKVIIIIVLTCQK